MKKKRTEWIEKFDCRWLDEHPDSMLDRLDVIAHEHGCWVRLWCNPCGREGMLLWLETQAEGDADGRAAGLRASMLERYQKGSRKDAELYRWFMKIPKEEKP